MPEAKAVRRMFAGIARRYDLLNRVLSLGIDQRWRKRVVKAAGLGGEELVVDVACGTGDLSEQFGRAGARVLGLDFTPEMVELAVPKGHRADASLFFGVGDALRLPLADESAEVASIAFGLRNLEDRRAGLAEMSRVLKPGGQLLVLEFSTPTGPLLGPLYRFYFTRLLPAFGRLVSGHSEAYSYLPRTVLAWPRPEELKAEMEALGLEDCGYTSYTFGIACLHRGRLPAQGSPLS